MNMQHKSRGFSLIELMVVLIIAAILVAIAIPSFRNLIFNSRMTSAANGVVGAINYARMEAVKRGDEVRLGQRNGGWAGGMVVWADNDGDDTLDLDEEIRLWEAIPESSTITSTQNDLVFNALGRADNSSIFTLCDDRVGEMGRKIELLTSGVVSVDQELCN